MIVTMRCALGLAAVIAAWALSASAAEAPSETVPPNPSAYQRLLDEFLVVTSGRDEPLTTRFDYARLHHDKERGKRLFSVREQLFGVTPSTLDPASRKAWAINIYNYVVIETVVQNFLGPLQKADNAGKTYVFRARLRNTQELFLDEGPFFEAAIIDIEGVRYSLTSFERHFLFEDFDPAAKQPPPPGLDPRMHFALARGAKGGPSLMPRAFRPDSLERQIDFAVRNALRSETHLRWALTVRRLEGSALLDWYKADFGGAGGVLAFVRKHAPPATIAEIDRRKIAWLHGYIRWDWDLNQVEDGGAKGNSDPVRKSG